MCVHVHWVPERLAYRLKSSPVKIRSINQSINRIQHMMCGWNESAANTCYMCLVMFDIAESDCLNVRVCTGFSLWKFTSMIIFLKRCILVYILSIASIVGVGIFCLKPQCLIFMRSTARGLSWEIVLCCQGTGTDGG